MEAKEQVLHAMLEIGTTVNSGKMAEIARLDSKEVNKSFAHLKRGQTISMMTSSKL